MKSSHLIIPTLGLVAVAFLLSQNNYSKGDQKKPVNPFEGYIVTVYLEGGDMESGQVLRDVEIKEINGAQILFGTGVDAGEEFWTAGMLIGIPLDSVSLYYLMTFEKFEEMKAKFR